MGKSFGDDGGGGRQGEEALSDEKLFELCSLPGDFVAMAAIIVGGGLWGEEVCTSGVRVGREGGVVEGSVLVLCRCLRGDVATNCRISSKLRAS